MLTPAEEEEEDHGLGGGQVEGLEQDPQVDSLDQGPEVVGDDDVVEQDRVKTTPRLQVWGLVS